MLITGGVAFATGLFIVEIPYSNMSGDNDDPWCEKQIERYGIDPFFSGLMEACHGSHVNMPLWFQDLVRETIACAKRAIKFTDPGDYEVLNSEEYERLESLIDVLDKVHFRNKNGDLEFSEFVYSTDVVLAGYLDVCRSPRVRRFLKRRLRHA